MQYEEYERQYNTALELFNKGKQAEGLEILHNLNNESFALSDIKIQLLLGSSLLEIEKYDDARPFFHKAIKIDERSESASLGIYITFAKVDRADKAIEEMKRFLDKYPAVLYKSALEDLLCDLSNGYAADYKEVILLLTSKYHIYHPQ